MSQGLEREAKVSEQGVDPEQTDDGEVSQHLVKVLGAVFTSNGGGFFISLHGGELLRDLRPLDQGVEHIEDAV
jgi:hypothetical protein